MWLDNKNPQTVFYVGAAATGLVAVATATAIKKDIEGFVKGVVIWLVVVSIIHFIIDWLVKNGHHDAAWAVAFVPLAGVVLSAKSGRNVVDSTGGVTSFADSVGLFNRNRSHPK